MMTQGTITLVAGLMVVAAGSQSDSSKEREKFQGTWWTVSMERDGRTIPAKELKGRRVIIKEDKYIIFDGDKILQRGTFKLDPSTTPRQIDTTPTTGRNAGKTDKGIYELKDGVLKLCYAPPGEPRPEEFSAEEGTGRWLTIDHRKKPESADSEKP